MKLTTKLSIVAAVLLLTACASGPRKVSMTEAMASENQIITAAKSQPAPPQLEKLYTQPINKTEPCKLPTSKDQLERKNFRAYWDGDCKDGYAYGLGRDIALSDTHHVEEITIHNGNGDSNGQPTRLIDYVQNFSAHRVYGTNFLRFLGTKNSSSKTAPSFPFNTVQVSWIKMVAFGTWIGRHSAQSKLQSTNLSKASPMSSWTTRRFLPLRTRQE